MTIASRGTAGMSALRWLTSASLVVLAGGFVVLLVYCVTEATANPGSSLVDAYWLGRLPWMGIAEGVIVSGATACAVSGAIAVTWSGGWVRRLLAVLPSLSVAFWWFQATMPPRRAVPCIPADPCPTPPIDPWAYAYSLPQTAALLLIVPAVLLVVLALATRRSADSEAGS